MSLSFKKGGLLALGLAVSLLAPLTKAHAAQITDVVDAADERWIGGRDNFRETKKDPFDFSIGVNFSQHIKNGIISREGIGRYENGKNYAALTQEMKYKYSDMMMNFDVAMGFYHDLGVYLRVPLVLKQTHNYRFADGIVSDHDGQKGNSSVYHSAADKNNIVPFDPNGNGFNYIHGTSIGNILLALKWSPLNDERNPAVANWTLSVAYEMPTAKLYDPATAKPNRPQVNAGSMDGLSIGDKAHRINVSIAMSKRLHLPKKYALDPHVKRRGFIDPYFSLFYSLPIASSDALPAADKAYAYDRKTSQYEPSHIAGFTTGMEVVAYEDVSIGRKVAFDFGIYGNYVSAGRGYTELTDALQRLTYYENYMRIGGQFNFILNIVDYVALTAGVTLGHETAHFLTFENSGVDRTGDGKTGDENDYNSPYYNPQWDQVGSRFRFEQVIDFSYNVALTINF